MSILSSMTILILKQFSIPGLQSRATIQDNTITTSPSALRVASSEFVVRNVGNEALSISSLTCMMTWNQILLMRKVNWKIWMKSKILHSRTVEDDIISGICVPCQLRNFDMINVNRIPTANWQTKYCRKKLSWLDHSFKIGSHVIVSGDGVRGRLLLATQKCAFPW